MLLYEGGDILVFSKIMKKFPIFMLGFFVLILAPKAIIAKAQETEISFDKNINNVCAGDSFDIKVNVSNISNLFGADFTFNYDPKLIKIISAKPGEVFSNRNEYNAVIKNDASKGIYTYAATLLGSSSPISNNGTLFTISVQALKSGTLKLDNTNFKVKLADNTVSKINYALKDSSFDIGTERKNLTKGLHEETDPNLKLVGNWITSDSVKNSGGSMAFSSGIGDYAEFSFEGTGFKFITCTGIYRSYAKITVDGKVYNVDNYTSQDKFKNEVFQVDNLNYGVHKVKIEVSSQTNPESRSKIVAIDAIEVLDNHLNMVVLKPGIYEENAKGLLYSGNWRQSSSSRSSGGSMVFSSNPGDSVRFSFEGTGFKFISSTGIYRSFAKITVDGKVYEVDTYSSKDIFKNQVFDLRGLPYGVHNVTIEVSSRANSESRSKIVALDAIEILGKDSTQDLTVLKPGVHGQYSTGIKFVGDWRVSDSSKNLSGTYIYSSTIGDYAEFSFAGTGFKFITCTGVYRAYAKITVDGKVYYADNYSSKDIFRNNIFELTDLPQGIHKVKIEVSSKTNPDSRSKIVAIDSIEVLNNPPKVSSILKPGIYEENAKELVYSGNWKESSSSRSSGSSMVFSSNPGDSVKFSFEGTGFKFISSTGIYRSFAKITVDGKVYDVDTYSSKDIFKNQVFDLRGLPYGVHNVTIEVSSRANSESRSKIVALDAIEILGNSNSYDLTVLRPGVHGQYSTGIKFVGDWRVSDSSKNLSGTYIYSSTIGDYAEFSFVGTGFKFITCTGIYRNYAKITVDGKVYEVDNYSSKDTFRNNIFELRNLSNGFHKVKIEVSPKSNPASRSKIVAIDAIEVLN